MDREAIKSVIEKQKAIKSIALGTGLGSDTRVDEVVAENARDTITELEKLLELPMHPDPEINKEVNADIRDGEEADKKAGLPPQSFDDEVENYRIVQMLETFTPTSENINKLPEPLKRFIMELETRCDPAGDVSKLILQKDTIKALELKIETYEKKDHTRTKEHNFLVVENRKLYDAVKKHHDQKGDDRCWIDDVELYTAAGLDSGNTALPSLPEFIGNCVRYHQSRQSPFDKYLTVEQQIQKAIPKERSLLRRAKTLVEAVLQYHKNRKGISRFLVEDMESFLKRAEKVT